MIGSGVDGTVDRAAGAGGGLPGHDLRRRAAARNDLEHRRRPVPPLRRVPTRARSRPNSWRSSPARSIIAGAGSRSWSATITASAGCRPMSRRDSPGSKLIANFPPINRMLTPRRASVPARQRAPLRHDVRRDRALSPADDPRRADRRRQDRGAPVRDSRRHRRASRSARLQLHRPRQPRAVRRPGPAPARGQLAILEPQPEVRYAFTGGPGYMFPRPDGIILGGTFELDNGTRRPSPRRSPRIIAATSASSPASAAPLEVPGAGPDIAWRNELSRPIPQSGGEPAEVLKDKLTPKAIVAALNEHIVGQDDAKRAVAVALRNRWRRQQLRPSCATRSRPRTS